MANTSLNHNEDLLDSIFLRPFELSDLEDFMGWATDDKVAPSANLSFITNEEQGLEFMKNVIAPHPYFRAICLKNNKAIGSIAATPDRSQDGECTAELGYAVASTYWGKGIATKAVRMVACNIFREWPHLKRLEALVEEDNASSRRVLEKAGFKKEGVLRKHAIIRGQHTDVIMYSLLSSNDLQPQGP